MQSFFPQDEKRSRLLFRSAVSSAGPGGGASGGGGRKKQHSLSIPADQGPRPQGADHSAQSPTNTEVSSSVDQMCSAVYWNDRVLHKPGKSVCRIILIMI